MPEVIDLSKLKKSDNISYDDLTPEEQAKVDKFAEDHADEIPGIRCRTAFLVIIDEEGAVIPVPDTEVKVDRKWSPTANDMLAAAALLQTTIITQTTATNTVMGMQKMAQMQMQAMQDGEMKKRLGL